MEDIAREFKYTKEGRKEGMVRTVDGTMKILPYSPDGDRAKYRYGSDVSLHADRVFSSFNNLYKDSGGDSKGIDRVRSALRSSCASQRKDATTRNGCLQGGWSKCNEGMVRRLVTEACRVNEAAGVVKQF